MKNLFIGCLIPILFIGCTTKDIKTIEVPKYIERPMPILKTYDVNSSYTFKGLKKKNGNILVPIKQFYEYIGVKKDLESALEKANNQVIIYNKLAKSKIKDK